MKFLATLVISALAVASAADVPQCDPSLTAVATTPDATACTAATGFSPALLKVPVGETLAKVCTNPSCQNVLAVVNKAVPKECMFGGVPIKATLLDKFPAACEAALKAGGGGRPPAVGGGNSTTPVGPANATMPAGSGNATKPAQSPKGPAVPPVVPPPTGGSGSFGAPDMIEAQVTMGPGSQEGATDQPKVKSPTTATANVPTPSATKKSSASSLIAATTSAVLVASVAALV